MPEFESTLQPSETLGNLTGAHIFLTVRWNKRPTSRNWWVDNCLLLISFYCSLKEPKERNSPRSERKKGSTLTDLVVQLECNVQLQDKQHELEPRTHLHEGERNVDRKHNVIGSYFLWNRFIDVSDFVAVVGSPGHEPFCLVMVFTNIHTFHWQVGHSRGGSWSWKKNVLLF